MMSRMNWMTYLRVLYYKIQTQLKSPKVDVSHMLEALSQIKNLLPLLPPEAYM